MRIAHVSDCYLPRLGGIERQVHDLALRQQAAGHDIEIITSVSGSDSMPSDPIRVHRPTAAGGKATAVRYSSLLSGRSCALTGGYDIIHVHASTMSPMAFLAAGSTTRIGIPTVITVHSLWDYATPIFRAANVPLRWDRWPLTWSAVSSAAAEPLRRMLGPATPVSILPNGVDTQVWQVAALPRDRKRIVLVSVMRLAARKRPMQLLKMLRQARNLVPADIRLEMIIVGDGPQRASMQRFLDRHEMGSWVRLTGAASHEQIRAIYADADFYVAPATLESFGIAALEARSAGLPVIAHANSGVRDFIEHDRDGLLAHGDPDMVSSIVKLATSFSMLTRLRDHNAGTPPDVSWPDVLQRCDILYERARLRVGMRGLAAVSAGGVGSS